MALTIAIHSSPFGYSSSPVFKQFKRAVVDRNVYDVGDNTYPIGTSGLTLSITGATATDPVYLYENGVQYQVLAGRDTYYVKYAPGEGYTSLYAVQGSSRSNVIEFNGDMLYTLVMPMFRVLHQYEDDLRQAWADGYLAQTITSVTGGTLTPSGRAMSQDWAQWMGVNRISGHTDSEFLNMLQDVLAIYQHGPVASSLEGVAEAAGGTGLTIHQRTVWQPFTTNYGRVQVTGSVRSFVTYPARLMLGNRFYRIGYGCSVLTGATGTTFLYVDSGVDDDGLLVIKDSATEPTESLITRTETIAYTAIQNDDTGEITGYIDGKYVVLEHPPLSLLSITGGGGFGITNSARIVTDSYLKKTAVVDLGTRLDASVIGAIDVVYQCSSKHYTWVLARFTSEVSISAVESCLRLGNGARCISKRSNAIDYLILADGLQTFELMWAAQFLRELAHPSSRGYLMAESSGTTHTTYMYHADGYAYQEVV